MAYQFVVVCVCVYSFTHHTQYYSSNDRTPLPVCMLFCSSHFLLCLFLQLWVHCYLFIIISTLLGAGYWFLSQSLISGVFTSVFFFSSDSVLTLWTTLFLMSHAHTHTHTHLFRLGLIPPQITFLRRSWQHYNQPSSTAQQHQETKHCI